MAEMRDYLAAERTFLAWIRTGLALMGFGFVVARFGLFLQQIQTIEHASSKPSNGLSLWLGTILIVAGILVNLYCAWRHVRIVRALDSGEQPHSRSLTLTVAIAIFLALIGIAMAVYLLSVRGPSNSHIANGEAARPKMTIMEMANQKAKKDVGFVMPRRGPGIVSDPKPAQIASF